MTDILSVQRHARARGKIIILNGNEIYNVPIVTVLKTFLHYNGGHLRLWSRYGQLHHSMDIAVMFCSNAISEYIVVYRARLILKRLFPPVHIANRVTINGNYGLLYIHGFCGPLSTCSWELSPLQCPKP